MQLDGDGRGGGDAAEPNLLGLGTGFANDTMKFCTCFVIIALYFLPSVCSNIERAHCESSIELTLRNVSIDSTSEVSIDGVSNHPGLHENKDQIIRQLKLRTAVSSVISDLITPFKYIAVIVASTYLHALLFRFVFPPFISALKSSEVCDVDLSPDAVTRNVADFVMDYVCEVYF